MTRTDTAHQAWDANWSTAEGRADWLQPHPDVAQTIELALGRNARTALDLGCGVGRHAVAMAQAGLTVTALDASATGLLQCRKAAAEAGVEVATVEAQMTQLPFASESFDCVVSFNVIYHGAPEVVVATVREVRRVLRPGGLLQGTLLSKRNAGFGVGEEIAPDTFVDPEAGGDKGHPHYYCSAAQALALLAGFECLKLEDVEHKSPGSGSFHWHFLCERVAP
jgi:SAM-dependent methyltransferase